jgi:hypothetical protein
VAGQASDDVARQLADPVDRAGRQLARELGAPDVGERRQIGVPGRQREELGARRELRERCVLPAGRALEQHGIEGEGRPGAGEPVREPLDRVLGRGGRPGLDALGARVDVRRVAVLPDVGAGPRGLLAAVVGRVLAPGRPVGAGIAGTGCVGRGVCRVVVGGLAPVRGRLVGGTLAVVVAGRGAEAGREPVDPDALGGRGDDEADGERVEVGLGLAEDDHRAGLVDHLVARGQQHLQPARAPVGRLAQPELLRGGLDLHGDRLAGVDRVVELHGGRGGGGERRGLGVPGEQLGAGDGDRRIEDEAEGAVLDRLRGRERDGHGEVVAGLEALGRDVVEADGRKVGVVLRAGDRQGGRRLRRVLGLRRPGRGRVRGGRCRAAGGEREQDERQ